jgi:hypothetical protein
MAQIFFYPPSSVSISAIGSNGLPIPSTSIEIGGENPSGNLTPVQVDASGNIIVDTGTLGGATAANQVLEIADLDAINTSTQNIDTSTGTIAAAYTPFGGPNPAQISLAGFDDGAGNTIPGKVDGSQNLRVAVQSSALPTGAATETTQLDVKADLDTISSNTGSISSALGAFSAKTAAGLVPEKFDEQVINYVGATDAISSVVYGCYSDYEL